MGAIGDAFVDRHHISVVTPLVHDTVGILAYEKNAEAADLALVKRRGGIGRRFLGEVEGRPGIGEVQHARVAVEPDAELELAAFSTVRVAPDVGYELIAYKLEDRHMLRDDAMLRATLADELEHRADGLIAGSKTDTVDRNVSK